MLCLDWCRFSSITITITKTPFSKVLWLLANETTCITKLKVW